ncbi:MAG: enoyl-CoA hydratase [Alphaproteobacteria bacterium]|nr:enoyl-CoA hydratase [Alphaproteobacteria bacterium]
MSAQPKPAENILLRHDQDGVATLTLNRPEARNALSRAMLSALQAELDAIKADRGIRAVVIAGAGPGFSGGHDLKEMRANRDRGFYEATLAQCSRMMQSIVRLPQPVIARVHGIATAAGCQLVASCDLAVASTQAQFATSGVNIGLFCSTPMVALSRNVARKHAMEMLLLGEFMDAETAWRFGLVNRVVAPEALDDTVYGMARRIASKSAHVLKIGKEAFYRQLETGLSEAYDYASRVMTANLLAKDGVEGVDAFLDKRKPKWCDE